MAVSFNDIRAACQSAQNRIMRLQQATNNQVGLTTSIREGWFEELRSVAQCFITAQQASAKLEQAVNTERAQLQGSLSAALNERDLRTSERDTAQQEINFLRTRLDEIARHSQRQTNGNDTQKPVFELLSKRDSWVMTGADSGASLNGDSPEIIGFPDTASTDILRQLPTTVEEMPFSNQPSGAAVGYNSSFSSSEPDTAESAALNTHYRSNTPRFGGRVYRNSQSKFFGRNGGPVLQRHQSGHTSSLGHRTPDISSGSANGRFSRTPGVASHGPFAPPPPQHVNKRGGHDPQTFQGAGGSMAPLGTNGAATAATAPQPFSPSQDYATSAPTDGQKSLQIMAPTAPRAMMAKPPRSQTPAPGKELALLREDSAFLTDFAPGVMMQRGSPDEERVYDVFGFFNKVKDWVRKYCSVPNSEAMHRLSHEYPRLWDYACSVTYPNNRHNAASHSLFMLCNQSFRTYFITRLLIQYVVQQMWSTQAWEGLDEKLTDTLVNVKQRLDLKYGYDAVLQPHERHALVEKRSRAIYDFMRQPNWIKCKSQKIDQAANRFKDIVGPMMHIDKVDHQEAVHELIGICEDGLRLSALLNTSRLSFQFIFNECGIKFSEQSHRPLNSNMPTRELQAHHWRVMCVVTPGITYRNDAGVSVDPRFLAKANVLLMQ